MVTVSIYCTKVSFDKMNRFFLTIIRKLLYFVLEGHFKFFKPEYGSFSVIFKSFRKFLAIFDDILATLGSF